MLSEKQCEELREMWCGEDDADTSYAYEDIPLLLNTIDELRAQATRDAALGAKVREAVGPRCEARWARIAAAIANDDLTRRVWFAIGRALEAEAQAGVTKEATDGSE